MGIATTGERCTSPTGQIRARGAFDIGSAGRVAGSGAAFCVAAARVRKSVASPAPVRNDLGAVGAAQPVVHTGSP